MTKSNIRFMRKIVIIGNGISGITCARNIRKKSDDEITIISGETEHFFSRTALMYIYMGHMKYEHTKPYEDFFWAKNNISLVKDFVVAADTEKKQLHTRSKTVIGYDILIIASGSITKKFNWPGQNLKAVVSLYSYQDLQEIETQTKNIKNAVIVGGGLIGVELAEMLHSRGIEVTLLVKEKYYWSSVLPKTDAQLTGAHIENNGIKILYETELEKIIGNKDGRVAGIITTAGQTIETSVVGITTGVTPNIAFLQGSGIETDKGVLVNEYFETNIAGVYAIGDCAEFKTSINGRKNIEQVWYTGRMHGETLAHSLCVKRTAYNPGPWFNSAKFFNLEYQTYGNVPASLKEAQKYFHWKHHEKDIALTLAYDSTSMEFLGINCFGIRLRHAIFDKWLTQKASIHVVLKNFETALFDKEFTKNRMPEITNAFNEQTGSSIQYKKKKLFGIFNF